MGTFEPYTEGHYQSAAQVAKSAHDMYMQQPVMPSASGMQRSAGTMPSAPMAGMTAPQTNLTTGMPGSAMTAQPQQPAVMSGMQDNMMGRCRLSTRNIMRGRVASVTPGAVNAIVVVAVGGGQSMTAAITMDSLRDLGLRVGSQVTVAVNPNAVLLIG
ncbi:TOBE domain-containing protein [Ethanoligenens sp.]|uniref:TOBE domain-containing protein n=1 Tax=Ethanoligenens sp. TaxID=2099655 RepID=UPI0039EB5633